MSFRIIPEDAGNTLDVVEQQRLRQDHPRALQAARRIIPADAGSTSQC